MTDKTQRQPLAPSEDEMRQRAEEQAIEIGWRCRDARGQTSQAWALVMLQQEEGLVLSTRALSQIENGKRALKLAEAAALARVYGVELASLAPGYEGAGSEALRRDMRQLNWMRNLIDERTAELRDALGEE